MTSSRSCDFRWPFARFVHASFRMTDGLVPSSAVGAFVPKDLVSVVAAKHRDDSSPSARQSSHCRCALANQFWIQPAIEALGV